MDKTQISKCSTTTGKASNRQKRTNPAFFEKKSCFHASLHLAFCHLKCNYSEAGFQKASPSENNALWKQLGNDSRTDCRSQLPYTINFIAWPQRDWITELEKMVRSCLTCTWLRFNQVIKDILVEAG